MPFGLRFEWDPAKSRANARRHGVTFEEASTAFLDENGIVIDDPVHSAEEERFVLLGLTSSLKLLVICHCYRHEAGFIRLISARKAGKRERTDYFGRFKP
jgi:uncharacterized protein